MCEPTTILLVGTALSAGIGLVSQQQTAKNVNAANAQQRVAVNAATIENYTQANRQGIEDRENATVEMNQIEREKASRLASARVSAGAAGVGGASVDALLLDLAGKGLEAGTTSATNYARLVDAHDDRVTNIGTNQRSQLAGIRDQSGPGALDFIGAGLRVSNAYATSQQRTQTKAGA